MNYFIVIVLCVVFLSVSVVFNQDIKETSIDIHSSVEVKSDAHKSDDDSSSSSSSYEALLNYTNEKGYLESAAIAIADVLNEFFIKQNLHFDILMIDYAENYTRNAIGEIGKFLPSNYAVTIKKIDLGELDNIDLDKSALILMLIEEEDMGVFNAWFKLVNVFPKKMKFLIYTNKSGDLFEASRTLTRVGYMEQFEYFIVDKNDEELELATFEWFTEEKCNIKTYKVLNTFNRTSLKWQKKLENHEKFKNLHNCMIHAHTIYGIYDKKFNPRKQSSTYDILYIAAEKSNFTVIQGENVKNAVLFCQIGMDGHFLSDYKSYHFTTTYAEEKVILMITPGELYNSYEKILMPFDELTWYFLIVTFGVAFGVIFVVNLMPKHIQNTIYGEGISVPAFNVVGTFFGIGQARMPTANFPRFIVMIFILFCLIIRTAYQGVMFDMMTKEMRKKSPQTIDDLFEWNFSVNLLTGNSNFKIISEIFFNNIDKNKQNAIKKFEFNDLYENFCSNIFNPKARFAVNTDFNLYNIMTQVCKKAPMLLNEEFITIPIGFAIDYNNFLYDAIEEVMQLTIPTGIPQYWSKYHQWYRYERNHFTEIVEKGAQMLRLEDLSFGFIIWLIACGVAVLGLLCELIVFAINKLKRLTRVEPIINNTNILQPKKPVKNKVRKAKKQRVAAQQKSTLDVQILIDIQAEILKENNVDLNPSEINQNNDENLQQADINQQQTVLQMEDDIDEESESERISIISSESSSKLEIAKISIEDERSGSQRSLKSSCNVAYQDFFDFDKEDKIESGNSSKLEIAKVSSEDDKTPNSKSFYRFKQPAVSGSGNDEDLQVTDLENDVDNDFESRISSKENHNKIEEKSKNVKIETCSAVDAENDKTAGSSQIASKEVCVEIAELTNRDEIGAVTVVEVDYNNGVEDNTAVERKTKESLSKYDNYWRK